MKNRLIYILILAVVIGQKGIAQENMHPAPPQATKIAILGGTIHIGNGKVIEQGTIIFENGKIISISDDKATGAPAISANTLIIDATGKQIYPGIIAANTKLGLIEVESTKSTRDNEELGDNNAAIRSLVAYNTDSKVINTVRSNGVLLASIVPEGGTISGNSSVVQLDAWNWEDAAYKVDNGIHLNMPSLININRWGATPSEDAVKKGLEKVEKIRSFFKEAKGYLAEGNHTATNLKFEAVRGLFDGSKTLFIHCDLVKEMLVAIDLAKEFGFKLALVGATDSWMITDILKANKVSIILSDPHSLPLIEDDAIDQPYKTGAALEKAGILFTIYTDLMGGFYSQRNIPFMAGTLAAYGLTKEEALQAITLNAAKILGIDDKTGSLEPGKDANIVISNGDILDMKSSNVTNAFIQGRALDLDNKQKQLFEKYKYKYGIK
jgi:imidazolonepropionase-like amidohydrolase